MSILIQMKTFVDVNMYDRCISKEINIGFTNDIKPRTLVRNLRPGWLISAVTQFLKHMSTSCFTVGWNKKAWKRAAQTQLYSRNRLGNIDNLASSNIFMICYSWRIVSYDIPRCFHGCQTDPEYYKSNKSFGRDIN